MNPETAVTFTCGHFCSACAKCHSQKIQPDQYVGKVFGEHNTLITCASSDLALRLGKKKYPCACATFVAMQ